MPYIQIGKDLVCIAETDCGKNLSYLFPIIGQLIIQGVPDNPFIKKQDQNQKNENNDNKKENENKKDENNNQVKKENEENEVNKLYYI